MKILISTSTFATQCTKPLEILVNAGYVPVLNPHGRRLKVDEIIEMAKDAVGIIAGTERLDDSIFKETPLLRVVSRCGAGLDSIDLKAAKKRKIDIYSTPDTPVEAVAELTIALILGTLRQTAIADHAVRQKAWNPLMGQLLFGKTVGLIGLGRIGRRVAALLKPYHVKILARDRCPARSFAQRHRIQFTNLPDLLEKSDIISLHVTLDDDSRNMIGPAEIAKMKRTAILINTARGELVQDKPLALALMHGRLAGAGIDVFPQEPYEGPLLNCPNTLLTSHMGSYAIETRLQMELQSAKNLIQGLKKI